MPLNFTTVLIFTPCEKSHEHVDPLKLPNLTCPHFQITDLLYFIKNSPVLILDTLHFIVNHFTLDPAVILVRCLLINFVNWIWRSWRQCYSNLIVNKRHLNASLNFFSERSQISKHRILINCSKSIHPY